MKERYAPGSIFFHWLMVILILGLFGLGWYMVGIPRGTPPRGYFFNIHKSFGIISIVVIAFFIGWRLRNTPPRYPDTMARWEVWLSLLAHWLMYLLLIVVPLTGYVEANCNKYGIHFFNTWHLPPWGPDNKVLAHWLTTVHDYTANIFAALVAIHIGAAIKHWLIDRDRILQRMLPFD